MEHVGEKNFSPQPSPTMHGEAVTRTNESPPLLSDNSVTELASHPLSAYSITGSQQKTTPSPETVESMEMALQILNAPPVMPTLSGELERYRNNLSDIQQAFGSALNAKSINERSKNWNQCETTAKVLLAVLDEKQGKADCLAARNALKQWVQSYILLASTNQSDLGSYPESPAKTQDEFITWCLAVARAASIGTPTIACDASLEYLCYIRAFNAGCAAAQLFIVRDHLLGELYRKTPSCQRFLPMEAKVQLRSIAARKERILRPKGLDETHYEIIYELVNLIRSDSKDRESKRDTLANRWIACKEYAIQQLVPMLYLQDAYGNPDTKKAHTHLTTISYERCRNMEVFPSFESVHQYWVAEIEIADGSNSAGIQHMEILAVDMNPAALYSLIENGQSHNTEVPTACSLLLLDRLYLPRIKERLKNKSLNYYFDILEYMELNTERDNQWYFPMIIVPSFNSPLAYKFYTFWQGFSAEVERLSDEVNAFKDTHLELVESIIILQGTIDQASHILSVLYTTCGKKTSEKCSAVSFPPLSDLYLPRGSVKKLAPSIHELENKFPFVKDPQMLVFRHFSDFLTWGKANKKLLDYAMKQNPVATCYRLLSLNHCTETWGYNRLIAILLEHTKGNINFLKHWRDDAGFVNFIKQMTGSYTLKYSAAYCQLMLSISKWINDKEMLLTIYKRIVTRKLIQGEVLDDENVYQKAMKLTTSDLKNANNKLDGRNRMLRSSMPRYYLDIYEAGFHWLHSCNLIYDFNTLIRTGKHLLKNNNDPAAHLAWCYRVTPFFLLKYFSHSCSLKDTSPLIAVYKLQKKISSKISRLNQGLMIATAKKVEDFLANLPGEASQTKMRKHLNETIAEIRNIAKTAILRQFSSFQESSVESQGDSDNLCTAEPDNDISECTLVTDDIYPEPSLPGDCYKDITNFITEHIFAPIIREARSLQSAMARFDQLNESDDFNSVRFTVLLIDTISRMETEYVPRVMERVCFCLDRLKADCERSVRCFGQYILKYNMIFFLKDFTSDLSAKMIGDLNVELEALKTSIWVAYPDISVYSRMPSSFFREEQSISIFYGRELAQSINGIQALLEEVELHIADDVLLMMKYIRSINKRENFDRRFKLEDINKNYEVAKLICTILTGDLDNYSLSSRCGKNKQQYTNAILIWLALESGKFKDATLNKVVDAKLEKTTAGYHLLKSLLVRKSATAMNHITRFLLCTKAGSDDTSPHTVHMMHAVALAYKLIGINKIGSIPLLANAFAPNFSYILAMLQWRLPDKVLASGETTMDKIGTVLVASGREEVPEASCRLFDFILEQERRGKAVSDITVYQCCRFIHARTFNATDEQTLYQGITLYLGKGCVSDKEEGLRRIYQALESGSPIPALRMARLQGQQLFPADVLEQDCLKLFAQKADTDQELYRDYKQVLFIELLLSLGESGLDWLIRQLESAPGDDISSSRIAELFQKKFDIWRESGIESTQQPSQPEEKGVAATVISKQPSQSAVEPKSYPIRSKREKKGRQQEARQGRKSKSIPCPAVRHEKPVTIQQLLEQLVMKNKDKANSEIPDEEITELLKLLEQLKRNNTTAIRGLSKNRLANLVRMLPWSATILGEVIAAHLKNMTDLHARANYARQQLERYECLITAQLTVTGDAETQPQGAMAKAQAGGKLLMQHPVPPGVQELIKNTTQDQQETLLSGNLSKDELSAAVSQYPDLYLHYLKETKSHEINCVKNIWEGLGTTSQEALLIKTGAILITDQCGTDQDSAIKILNDEKLSNDTRLSLFQSLQDGPKEALLSEGIPDNLVRAYLERMKKTQPKQDTTKHKIKSINQWLTSLGKRLTDNLIHLMKEFPPGAEESDRMKLREFREALEKEMDLKIESARERGASLTTNLVKCFKASAILMELNEIARSEAEQETLQPG